jgi:conjugal transfer pilus assembly protein TraD
MASSQDSSQDDDVKQDNSETNATYAVAVIFFLASPLTIISGFLTYVIFAVGRIRMSVIFWYGLFPYLIGLVFFYLTAIRLFVTSWKFTVPNLLNKRIEPLEGILTLLAQQALIAIPLGITIGLFFCAQQNKNRPEWEEIKFRLTPRELFLKRKVKKDIQFDKNTPKDGMTLGVQADGKRVVQTYKESTAHTIILGASGAGKTTTLKSRLRDSIKAGQGAAIVDLKGGPGLAEEVAELAERYGKKFIHWTFQPKGTAYDGPAKDGIAYYDPIARGEATRRKDLLVESRKWTEEYYKIEASAYLQLLFSVLVANPDKSVSTIGDVVKLLDPVALQERAIPLGVDPEYADVIRAIDEMNDKKISAGQASAIGGLKSQLSILLHSIAGPYLQLDPKGDNNIDLGRAAHEGHIVMFSLDSNNYGELASLVANLIIQDLKTVSSELLRNPAPQPFQVIIDEFQAVGSENVIGLINKSRESNMPVTLTTQALGDLRAISPSFLDQLLGIVNSFIIHRANKFNDAEEFAGLTGKIKRKTLSESVKYSSSFWSKGATANSGHLQEVEEFVVKPDDIIRLKTGEMIYVNKSPMRVVEVLCIPEDPSLSDLNNSNREKLIEKNTSSSKKHVNLDKEDLVVLKEEQNFPTPPKQNVDLSKKPVSIPAIGNSGRMPEAHEPYSTEENKDYNGIAAKPANRDRLRELLSQSPDILVPEDKKKDQFVAKHMPPKVSPPLPPARPIASRPLPPLPTLPSLPALPKTHNNPLPKPITPLPSFPAKPVKEEKKVSKNADGKDEFGW